MKIIVNNQGASSIIDTADTGITEVMGMIAGALVQEGFHIDSIKKGFENKLNELSGKDI